MQMNERVLGILRTITAQRLLGKEPRLSRLTRAKRDKLLALAHHNQLRVLVTHNLLSQAKGAEKQELKRLLLHNSLRNSFLRNEIKQLARALNRRRLKAVFFAGLVNEPDEELQSPGDIDLLVHPSKRGKARKVIEAQGFGRRDPRENKSWEMDFVKKRPFYVEVDLHWQLTYPTHGRLNPLDTETIGKLTESFRRNALPRQFNSVKLLQPRGEDLLLYQIIHFVFNHKARGLKRLYDIAKLTGSEAVDWKSFTRLVEEANLGSFVFFALDLADQMLSARPPTQVLETLKPTHLLFPLARKITGVKKICNPYPERHVPQSVLKKAGVEQTKMLFLLYDKPLTWKLRFLARSLVRPKLIWELKEYLILTRKDWKDQDLPGAQGRV